jgi:hypothetical protein
MSSQKFVNFSFDKFPIGQKMKNEEEKTKEKIKKKKEIKKKILIKMKIKFINENEILNKYKKIKKKINKILKKVPIEHHYILFNSFFSNNFEIFKLMNLKIIENLHETIKPFFYSNIEKSFNILIYNTNFHKNVHKFNYIYKKNFILNLFDDDFYKNNSLLSFSNNSHPKKIYSKHEIKKNKLFQRKEFNFKKEKNENINEINFINENISDILKFDSNKNNFDEIV